MKRPTLLLIAVLAAVALPAGSAEIVFEGDLDGPTVGSDSPATGHAVLVLNEAQTEVAYEITYSNLVGDEIAAHFHAAPPGTFGPIVFELPLGTPKVGVWAIPPQRLSSLLDGHIYVVIHSDAYPAAEIGGWVAADQVPAAAPNWSLLRDRFRGGRP